jgi:hypothetical protein
LNLCGFFEVEYNNIVVPSDGDAMASLLTFFPNFILDDTTVREFMQGALIQTLDTSWYFVSTKVLSDPENRTNSLSILFSDNDLGQISSYPIHVNPQVNFSPAWIGGVNNWSANCNCVNSLAGSNFFTIGNFTTFDSCKMEFLPDPNFTNRIYLDEVAVIKIRKLFNSKTIKITECIQFSNIIDSISFEYYLNGKKVQEFCADSAGVFTIIQSPAHCRNIQLPLEIRVIEQGKRIKI